MQSLDALTHSLNGFPLSADLSNPNPFPAMALPSAALLGCKICH